MPTLPKNITAFIKRHRRRIAKLVAVLAFGVVGYQLWTASPRDVELRFDLGPRHERVTSIAASYRIDGEEVLGARFEHRRGAPRLQTHIVSLAPGRYEAVIGLYEGSELRRYERAFVVPAEGVIRLRLFDDRYSFMTRPAEGAR